MSVFNEASRNDLMAKSKRSQKGVQRYQRRVKGLMEVEFQTE